MTVQPRPARMTSFIREVNAQSDLQIEPSLLLASEPWVARGFANSWPSVKRSQISDKDFLSYLGSCYSGAPITAIVAEAQHKGRYFYNEDLTGFNFYPLKTSLDKFIAQLIALKAQADAPSVYVGSTAIDPLLPTLNDHKALAGVLPNATTSLWLGNRSRIAAHFDFPRNIACCVSGRRRFSLFPPDQVANLYVGPWDITPAGQPISLVDLHSPDFSRFPNFQQALDTMVTVDLEPGDALYIPSFWWHHVEGLSPINGLINFWWHETGSKTASTIDLLKSNAGVIHALPPAQRQAMKAFYDHYVFSDETDPEYLPK